MSSNQYPPYDPNQYPYGQPNPNPYPPNTVYPNPYDPAPAPPPPPSPGNPYGGYAAPTENIPAPYPYGPGPGQPPSGPYGPVQGQAPSNPNNQMYLRNQGTYADPSYPGMPGGQPVQVAPPQTAYGNGYGGPGNMLSSPPPQRPRNGTSPALRLLIIMLAVFFIIAGVGLYAFLSYQNTQKSNANATATAQTRSADNAASTASASMATATQTTNNVNATATVAASNANATATAQVVATATAGVATSQNPYPPNTGTLAFSDPLTADDNSLPNNGNCAFQSDGYHISAQQGFYDICPGSSSYSNFAFEVTMTINQGGCGGMLFRNDNANGKYYLFEVCADGTYGVYRYHGTGGNDYDTIKTGSSSAILTGTGQSNVIASVANGPTLTFYVNQQQIDQENDTNYVSGVTGLAADGSNDATKVTFTNERIWAF